MRGMSTRQEIRLRSETPVIQLILGLLPLRPITPRIGTVETALLLINVRMQVIR